MVDEPQTIAAIPCADLPDLDTRVPSLVHHFDTQVLVSVLKLQPDSSFAVQIGVIDQLADDELQVVEDSGIEVTCVSLLDQTPGDRTADPLAREFGFE